MHQMLESRVMANQIVKKLIMISMPEHDLPKVTLYMFVTLRVGQSGCLELSQPPQGLCPTM